MGVVRWKIPFGIITIYRKLFFGLVIGRGELKLVRVFILGSAKVKVFKVKLFK